MCQVTELWYPKYSNCVFWAFWAWNMGLGNIRFKRSERWENGFHCYIITPEGVKVSYEPLDKNHISFWGGKFEAIFKGEVVVEIEDKDDTMSNDFMSLDEAVKRLVDVSKPKIPVYDELYTGNVTWEKLTNNEKAVAICLMALGSSIEGLTDAKENN